MSIADLRINADRMRADFDALADIGATVAGGVSRIALSNEDLEARAWFASHLEDAGLVARDDDAGNISGVLVMTGDPAARSFLVGSHLDTSLNGGKYDGTIGVLAGLECLRTIKEAGLRLPVNLEVINFTDQEGAWQSLMGSRALTGKLPDFNAAREGEDQSAFRAALFRAGIYINDLYKARRTPEEVAGYLELHIEQGARLWRSGVPIGIVTGIVGRTTYNVIFHGEAAHSGTTALKDRKDALHGAAAFITEAHQWVRRGFPEGLFNAGNISAEPGAFNTVPSKATVLVELRNPDEATLAVMELHMLSLADEVAARYSLRTSHRRVVHMPAAKMAAAAVGAIESSCKKLSIANYQRLISFAGHDAQMLSDFTPSGMIFVPSVEGLSHNPREFTEWDNVTLGANVLLQTLIEMASNIQG